MIQTLIFDWDGTLHDTASLYHKAFCKAYEWLRKEGLAAEKEYTVEDTSVYLGMNIPDMWKAFMPELESEKQRIASGIISQEMDRLISAGEARLYPDTISVLQKLKEKGYHLVILSNCRHTYLMEHKKQFGLERFFDGFYAAEDYDFRPKEDIFPEIAAVFPGEYLVIGDRDSDIKTAVVHGLHSVACDYGFGKAEELQEAEYHISSIEQLLSIL